MRQLGIVWTAAVLALAVVACDDESTSGTTPTATTSAGVGGAGGTGGLGGSGGTAAAGGNEGGTSGAGGAGGQPDTPGTITISTSGRNGDDGKRLIASVLPAAGSSALGGMCETISGGAASGIVGVLSGLDICDIGSAVTFDPGTYSVRGGIYPAASAAPELCASANVTVGGDVTVELTNFSACQ